MFETIDFYQDKSKELKLILGAFIKYQRIEENMSLNFVSDVLKINKGYLSEVENGKRFLSENHIDEFMDFLDISFHYDKNLLYELRNILESVMNSYINLDLKKISKLYNKVFENKEQFENSYGFFVFKLLVFTHDVIFNGDIDEIYKMESFFSKFSKIYSSKERMYFYLMISNFFVKNNDFENSNKYLTLGYELAEISSNTQILAVLQHIEASLLCYYGYGNKAYIKAIRSLDYFKNTFNFNRIIYINNTIGLSMIGMGLFHDAEEHYLKMLESIDKEKQEARITILDNLSWCTLLWKKYEKTLYYVNLAIEEGSDFEELYVNQALAYYKLNKLEACKKTINDFYVASSNNYFREFMNLLFFRMIHADDDFEINAINFLDESKKKRNVEMEKITLELIVEFYEEHRNQLRINKYLKQLIECLSYN